MELIIMENANTLKVIVCEESSLEAFARYLKEQSKKENNKTNNEHNYFVNCLSSACEVVS